MAKMRARRARGEGEGGGGQQQQEKKENRRGLYHLDEMMEVSSKLWVGSQTAYEEIVKIWQMSGGWAVVQACKEPYHREALGYTERGAPRSHEEYLVAYRDEGSRLILNMVDSSSSHHFPDQLFTEALAFLAQKHGRERKPTLIHCNRGESRAPSLALLYLAMVTRELPAESFEKARAAFLPLYAPYQPGKGIQDYLRNMWPWYLCQYRIGKET